MKANKIINYKKDIEKEKTARKNILRDSEEFNGIVIKGYDFNNKIDYEHYINKQIKPIADSILTFFNTNFDNLIKGKQVSLFDY